MAILNKWSTKNFIDNKTSKKENVPTQPASSRAKLEKINNEGCKST